MERKKKYDKKEEVKVGREEQVDNKDSSAVKKTHISTLSARVITRVIYAWWINA